MNADMLAGGKYWAAIRRDLLGLKLTGDWEEAMVKASDRSEWTRLMNEFRERILPARENEASLGEAMAIVPA